MVSRDERLLSLLIAWALSLLAGCAPTTTPPLVSDTPTRPAADPPLGGDAERRLDFGTLVAEPGLSRSHVYKIINRSDHPIRLIDAINNKPCCGSIAFRPVALAPGESGSLEVTIRIERSLQPITHLATVQTDDESSPILEFWTTATPIGRIEVTDLCPEPALLLPTETAQRRFQVVSRGTDSNPAVELGDSCASSSLPLAWEGPACRKPAADGVIEIERVLIATLRADGEIGARGDDIMITAEGIPLSHHFVHWEVIPAVRVIPAALVLQHDEKSRHSLLLRSTDGIAFSIKSAECDVPGIEYDFDGTRSDVSHRVVLGCLSNAGDPRQVGHVRVSTDHPKQPSVVVPLYLSGAARVREGETLP